MGKTSKMIMKFSTKRLGSSKQQIQRKGRVRLQPSYGVACARWHKLQSDSSSKLWVTTILCISVLQVWSSPGCSIGIRNSCGFVTVHRILPNVKCRLEAQPDKKEKNKITDTSTQIEGEPSQAAPDVSDEEMAEVFRCCLDWSRFQNSNFSSLLDYFWRRFFCLCILSCVLLLTSIQLLRRLAWESSNLAASVDFYSLGSSMIFTLQ